MLNLLISILAIVMTIFIIVGIHEFGHFLAARWLGVKVLCFSIGFGKALYRWRDKKGTEYLLAAIPLGGYVKMLDEDEAPVKQEELPLAYNQQPFYKKFIIVIAGPLSNLVLALFLYWLLFMIGFTSVVPVIGKILPNSIAADAGLKPQQEIIRIDDTQTRSWMSVLIRLLARSGDTSQLKMETKALNNSTSQSYSLNLQHWQMDKLKPDPISSLGIMPYEPEKMQPWPKNLLRKNQYGPIAALTHAWRSTYDFSYLNVLVLAKLVTGKVSIKSLGGPITIFQGASSALNQGFLSYISFLAFLSIAIGIINIFPIPGLDGGHILFQIIEAIARRPIPPAIQNLAYRLGLIFLILIIFQSIINDILRL